jgi:hypothetical protein
MRTQTELILRVRFCARRNTISQSSAHCIFSNKEHATDYTIGNKSSGGLVMSSFSSRPRPMILRAPSKLIVTVHLKYINI